MSDISPLERIAVELERMALEMAGLREAIAQLHLKHGTRLTRAEVCERVGVHRNTLPRLMESGFPRPTPDGHWLLGRVIQWEGKRPITVDLAAEEPIQPDGKRHHLYRHFDAAGRLLYVGISLNALQRLLEHDQAPWFDEIVRVEISRYPTRLAALAAERQAIRGEGPAHNIMHARKAA